MSHSILERISGGEDLTMEEMSDAIDHVMRGDWSEREIGLLLTGLRAKGETVEEIAGAAAAMRKHMIPVKTRRERFIDTCGTGGDGSGTFNISTAAALVTAAAGLPVAKHGNRKITSKSGSADVLAELGVNVEAGVETVQRCLDEVGICFCFAPQLHVAMKHVAAVRRKLGAPTIFNLLGPLSNPASAPFQLLGVGKPELREVLASALALLGIRRAAVVCGRDGLDEVTTQGPTDVSLVTGSTLESLTWTATEFGLPEAELGSMKVDGPRESAERIREVLEGKSGPSRDIVVLNAAAALWTAAVEATPRASAERAAEAIDKGAARKLLSDLAAASQE